MKTPKAKARARKRVRRKLKGRDLNGYRSGFELDTASTLRKKRKKHGFEYEYETVVLEYTIPARLAKYTPDFPVTNRSGHVWYLETKGRFVAEDRKKHRLLKEQRPDLDIRIYFMKDNPIRKGSKTKYSDWCRKLQIPYCVGELDIEWFDT
jgi:hypothetical protein